jgi:hypothetical protein
LIVTQVVQVRIEGAPRTYTYGWKYDPVGGGLPLSVGQRVEIPPNMVQEDGGSATVVKLGSDYTGPMKDIVKAIDDPEGPSPDEDLWGGWGQGRFA